MYYGGAHDFYSLASSPNKSSSLSSRKPLRSSPLAGPALSHSHAMQTDVDSERKSLIYSTPPSPSPVTFSPQRLRTPINLVRFSESLLNRSRARTTNYNTSSALHLPTASAFHQTYNDYPPLSYPPLPPVPALVSVPFSTDEVSPLVVSRTHHRTLSEQPKPKAPTSTIRPPFTPSRRNPQTTLKIAPLTSTKASHIPSPSKSQEGFNNWMTANTYATTPRFSRLSITAPNVVLPIPAREYKRAAKKKAKFSPGRGLPHKEIRSLESITTTESTVTSSSETLSLSLSSVTIPYDTSLSHKETVIGGERNINIIGAEPSGYSHSKVKRCSSPSSTCSCESTASHIYTGRVLETVIEGCTEDGFIIGRRKSSVSMPGSDMIGQGETQSGVLSKFWKRIAGAKKRCK
ncbi:hypothetical protein C0993_007878 [Termitomyces sp. T159_Od127]|nr:hypothetical protein C0993_007878 [Termitomyces sp. T159_Od127]